MASIVVIGSSNTDIVVRADRLPRPGETVIGDHVLMNPGGKGANQAVAAARLGGQVAFIARVGGDFFGRQALEHLKGEGLDTRSITVDPQVPSGVATILVDGDGENCIVVAPGANQKLEAADLERARHAIEQADVLLMQLETPVAAIEYAVSMRSASQTVILNPAPAQKLAPDLLSAIDVLTPNETEAEVLTGVSVGSQDGAERAAQVLRGQGVKAVSITRGAAGAFVASDAFTGPVAAPRVAAVDTTAAGDTFNGALAVALADRQELAAAVRFACQAAALAVTRLGAQRSLPTLEELRSRNWT